MASVLSAGTTSNTALNLSADTTGILQFQTNGTTAAMTINTSQNVGIGTSSPTCRLDLNRGSAGLLANFTDGVNTNFQIETASLLATIGPSAGSTGMAFKTGNTERMRIDSSGKVGIGTTTMTNLLNVAGAIQSSSTLVAVDANTVALSQESGYARLAAFGPNASTGGTLYLYSISSNGSVQNGAVIDSSGYVGIGTTTPASYGALAVRKGINGTWLGVSGNCSFQTSDNNLSSLYVVHSSANSNTTFIGADSGGRLQMFCSQTAAGGVYLANGGTSWTSASDERVKENLEPIQNGLEKVTSLRAVTGNYIADETKKSKAFLIAQDVEAVLPEAVDSSNPDELGLSYTDTIPLLVAAIKELKAELDATKAEVAALKGVN